jgi:RimJ/RimL family protein N-acetyltransferase
MFRLYFEAGLEASREFLIGQARRGLAFSIDFDAVTVRTTVGELAAEELDRVAELAGRAELHLEPGHREAILGRLAGRVVSVKTLRYYRTGEAPSGPPDPRCRLLTEADFDEAARLFRDYYPATVFSSWMLELPFAGLFEEGRLAACGGVHAINRQLGACVLGNFLTHPGHRGRGLAQAVARALLGRLAEDGLREFLLGAAEENAAACRAYEAVGFRLLEARPQIEVVSAG